MRNKFSPETEDTSSDDKKRSQQRLLLLLLLLIALFAYLYFFTGLIRPLPETAQAPSPEPAAQTAEVVKQPIPPRGAGEAPAETTAAAPAAAPVAPAAAPAAAPAPDASAKPAAPAAKSAAAAKEAKPAAAAKEAKPAAAAKEAKPAAAVKEAKPAAAAREQKSAAAKPAAKTAAKPAAKATAAAPKTAKARPAAGGYALEINGDLAQAEVSSVVTKLKKAGITQVATTKSQKGEPMHRLFLADFGDRNEAAEELERLKLVAPNAFMLNEKGRWAVYAGSFLRQGKAAVEQDRLYDKGVRLVLKEAMIPVAVAKVRAGSFPDVASAEKAAVKLKGSGLAVKVVKVGK